MVHYDTVMEGRRHGGSLVGEDQRDGWTERCDEYHPTTTPLQDHSPPPPPTSPRPAGSPDPPPLSLSGTRYPFHPCTKPTGAARHIKGDRQLGLSWARCKGAISQHWKRDHP